MDLGTIRSKSKRITGNLPPVLRPPGPYKLPAVLVGLIVVILAFVWHPSRKSISELRSSPKVQREELAVSYASLEAALRIEDLRKTLLQTVQTKESRLRTERDRAVTAWDALCRKAGVAMVSVKTGSYEPCPGDYERAPFQAQASGPIEGILKVIELMQDEVPGLSVQEFEIALVPGQTGTSRSYTLTVKGSVFLRGSAGEPGE